jgi:hypothetical protein
VNRITETLRFFHWEVEFPDVMTGPDGGFHAIVGNPPWETQKPNSMEFFSNVDPMYRTYTKQEALRKQRGYFESSRKVEERWLRYNAHFKSLSNWTKHVAFPFGAEGEQGQPLGKIDAATQSAWRERRLRRPGYTDPKHPFRHQGSADINTYKMFVEACQCLLRRGGNLGLLVPSSIYSDGGTRALRNLLLDHCSWTHLYAFQNERFVFDGIDHRFKIAIIHATKGKVTSSLKTRFRLGPGGSPEPTEIEADISRDEAFLPLPSKRIGRFSPTTRSILEIQTERDLQVLESLYSNAVLLGDKNLHTWNIKYANEFHVTNDSGLFAPRPDWESAGYKPDEYGHWLKGAWRQVDSKKRVRDWGRVRSADGSQSIALADIEGVSLPVYEGRMVDQFDYCGKGWVSGRGRTAVWDEISWNQKQFQPQYLMDASHYLERRQTLQDRLPSKLGFMNVTASTNERTFIGSVLPAFPAIDKVPTLISERSDQASLGALLVMLNSMVSDWVLRQKLGGNSLTWATLQEHPVAPVDAQAHRSDLCLRCLSVSAPSTMFASTWLPFATGRRSWRQLWAITQHERARIRAILEACAAYHYGLNEPEFRWIVRECDHPVALVCNGPFSRTLSSKGFWRVDKEKQPELRLPVLAFIAFAKLKAIGLDRFLQLNEGDGWYLPEAIRLADYELGHDERARRSQPVASALGERFLPWQLEDDIEASWDECRRHAELREKIVPTRTPSVPPSAAPLRQVNLPAVQLRPIAKTGRKAKKAKKRA